MGWLSSNKNREAHAFRERVPSRARPSRACVDPLPLCIGTPRVHRTSYYDMVSPTKPAERCGPPPTRPRQLSAAAVSHRCARRKFFPNPALYFLPSFSLHSPDFLAALKARRPALYAPAFCALLLFGANSAALSAWCQAVPDAPAPASSALTESNNSDSSDPVDRWEGLPVRHISFSGVPADRLTPLSGHLAQAEGAPLIAEDLKKSLRQLYATGLYDNVEVQGTRQQDGLSLVFLGTPRTFIGLVSVDGATGATMNSLLQRATQLEAGTRFTQAKSFALSTRCAPALRTTAITNRRSRRP